MEGIVYFGSFGRKKHDFYSDLDIFIYLNQEKEDQKIKTKEEIRAVLVNEENGISIEFEIYDKWMIYTEKTFLKIEIGIKEISKATDDTINIVESRIIGPAEVIVYDKNAKVLQIYTDKWITLNDESRLKALFIEDAYKFIYYFEGFLSNLAKDDEYKAYMNYNIAFYKLVGLKAITKGEFYNIYQPRRFTTEIIDDWNLRVKYYRASAGLRKYDMIAQRQNLKLLFLDVLDKGIRLFNLDLQLLSKFHDFFDRIDEKFLLFKNMRDISLIPNNFSRRKKIQEGFIFRSASMSKNNSELILKFLKEKDIKYILDLRGEKEIENYVKYNNFYDNLVKDNYVVNIPFNAEIVKIYLPEKPYENFYYAFLVDFREQIKIIFEKYFANALSNKLIIHCEGGKDRTGIIIALLLDMLGISRELIIEDYLLSYSDTKRDYIDLVFQTIDNEYEGTENFLINYCNIPKESIKTIKEVLVEKH